MSFDRLLRLLFPEKKDEVDIYIFFLILPARPRPPRLFVASASSNIILLYTNVLACAVIVFSGPNNNTTL